MKTFVGLVLVFSLAGLAIVCVPLSLYFHLKKDWIRSCKYDVANGALLLVGSVVVVSFGLMTSSWWWWFTTGLVSLLFARNVVKYYELKEKKDVSS